MLEIFFSSQKLRTLRIALLKWFAKSGRHAIPWKLKPDGMPPKELEKLNPYGIWIAEIMLQQTQVNVVLRYWERWMNTFPTLYELSKASEHEVLLIWQGLGY